MQISESVFNSYLQLSSWTTRGWVWRCWALHFQCSGSEWGWDREETTSYTDTQEGGGAWTDGRGLLLVQKLTALTQLRTQTCTHTANTQMHYRLSYVKKCWDNGDSFNCVASSLHLCDKQEEEHTHPHTHTVLAVWISIFQEQLKCVWAFKWNTHRNREMDRHEYAETETERL